jgi:hypothetical protein
VRGCCAFGVEDAAEPVFVVPTRCADMDLHP